MNKPKVKSRYKKYFDELAETARAELSKINSTPVFMVPIPGYDEDINGGVSWQMDETFITLPPIINSHFRLYIVAHEIGHIVYRHMLGPCSPENEAAADEWALGKFNEWGLKVTPKIKAAMRQARFMERRI